MKRRYFGGLIMVMVVFCGCSSPTPSASFLASTLASPPSGEIGDAEALHMRAVDLYNLFDLNVTKKWKRVHENSWKIVVNGKDPSTNQSTIMVITLAVDPESDRRVLVRSISLGGKEYPPDAVSAMIRQLDKNYVPKGGKTRSGPG